MSSWRFMCKFHRLKSNKIWRKKTDSHWLINRMNTHTTDFTKFLEKTEMFSDLLWQSAHQTFL